MRWLERRGRTGAGMANHLYYGDNLDVLRESIRDESVDLIYLDPPFNSNATYNILFRAPSGEASQAQIEAFEDTWHWNDAAERAFDDVMQSGNAQAADMLRALRSFLRDNDVMAYIGCIAGAILIGDYRRILADAGFAHVEVIDSGRDLNAYAKVENQSGCCSPGMNDVSPFPIAESSCCGPNATDVHDDLRSLLANYDVNSAAASVKVYALKPAAKSCCGPTCCASEAVR